MKKLLILIYSITLFLPTIALTKNNGIYYSELKKFKKNPQTEIIFDEDANQGLSEINRDLLLYKNLSYFQRLIRFVFILLDTVIVTPETMPSLYQYVDEICKKANITAPTIFITRRDGFFNAAAQKLLMSSGGIIIGQKLLHDLSDDALEAVVAHEIGHIKYNHINKGLAVFMASIIVYHMVKNSIYSEDDSSFLRFVKWYALFKTIHLSNRLIIGKRFEQEADEFSYKVNGKAKGLIEFFELILKKDDLREKEFKMTYENIQRNKMHMSSSDYYDLLIRYYITKGVHLYNNFYKKIYYNTFIGAHPSPEARIAAAQEYL